MIIFTLRRLNLFIFTMVLLTVLSFSLSFLFPGEQIINLTGQINATPEQLAILSQQYQQHESVLTQYFSYVSHLSHGDMGYSIISHLPSR